MAKIPAPTVVTKIQTETKTIRTIIIPHSHLVALLRTAFKIPEGDIRVESDEMLVDGLVVTHVDLIVDTKTT